MKNIYCKNDNRIVQMICEKIEHPAIEKCKSFNKIKSGDESFG